MKNKNSKIVLEDNKSKLIEYMYSKIEQEDWHAVQDSASDLREIDAKLEIINEVKPTGG